MIIESMKKKVNTQRSSWLWRMLILAFLVAVNNFVAAEPDPLSSEIFADDFLDDTINSVLLHRLKQVTELKREIIEEERELTAAQIEIKAMLEAKARNYRVTSNPIPPEFAIDGPEMLPVPSAVVHPGPTHSGKRTSSYMALCHFKICNMGRKRQLLA